MSTATRNKLLRIALLLLFPFTLFSCIEDQPKPQLTELEKLPPATKTGRHTMGFLLNGKAWIPRSTIEYGAVMQSALSIGGSGEAGDLQVGFGMDVNKYPPLRIGETYSLADNDTASASMSVDDGVKKTFFCEYMATDVLERELLITHYDYQKRVIAGTFWATFLTEGCDTARVTDGRFDLKVMY